MNLREARVEDIATLFAIRTSVLENHHSLETLAALGVTPETIAQMLNTTCKAWIAELEEQAVGFSMANAVDRMIFGLFVRPAYERRGIGRLLLQQAEAWLWSDPDTQEIWLLTNKNPQLRAYGFYQHLGWMPLKDPFSQQLKFVKQRSSDASMTIK